MERKKSRFWQVLLALVLGAGIIGGTVYAAREAVPLFKLSERAEPRVTAEDLEKAETAEDNTPVQEITASAKVEEEIAYASPYVPPKKQTPPEQTQNAQNNNQQAAQTANKTGGYVIADSSSRLLGENDLAGLSSNQLRIARNEIYARHGRLFNDASLQAYFNGKDWYNGTISPDNFSSGMLSETERANLEFIKAHE